MWPKLLYPQTNCISSHLLCSVVSIQQNAINSVFSCSFMMDDFSLSLFFPSQLNQIHFLCKTTVFKRTARTDACQVFPDAPKQWLHSWQIPLILNLIRHLTVAYSILCVLASQPLCFLSSLPLSLPSSPAVSVIWVYRPGE